MKIEEIYMTIMDFFQSFLNKDGEIVKISSNDEHWIAHVEIIEDTEYTRKHAKRDLKAIYEVTIDNNMEICSYSKIKVIERGIPITGDDN
jgi:predicted class III extradiol MEMO1 family dioxygenase